MPYFECLYDKKKPPMILNFSSSSLLYTPHCCYYPPLVDATPLALFCTLNYYSLPPVLALPTMPAPVSPPHVSQPSPRFYHPTHHTLLNINIVCFFFRKCCTNTNIQIAGPKTFTTMLHSLAGTKTLCGQSSPSQLFQLSQFYKLSQSALSSPSFSKRN